MMSVNPSIVASSDIGIKSRYPLETSVRKLIDQRKQPQMDKQVQTVMTLNSLPGWQETADETFSRDEEIDQVSVTFTRNCTLKYILFFTVILVLRALI